MSLLFWNEDQNDVFEVVESQNVNELELIDRVERAQADLEEYTQDLADFRKIKTDHATATLEVAEAPAQEAAPAVDSAPLVDTTPVEVAPAPVEEAAAAPVAAPIVEPVAPVFAPDAAPAPVAAPVETIPVGSIDGPRIAV
jgi:hypothetical protein